MASKTCGTCGTDKPLGEFPTRRASKDGRGAKCKPCASDYARQHYLRNRERILVRSAANYQAKPEQYRRVRRAWRLRTKYDLTPEQYDEMSAAQGGLCAICGKAQLDRNLMVDHCHRSGRVRGLLCDPCNRGIGFLQEDPFILETAQVYLATHGGDAQ